MTVEREILSAYDSNLKAVYSINEISKKTGKAYPYINKKVNTLIDQGILNKKELGRTHLCSLNLKNKQTIMLLSMNEISKHKKLTEEIKQAIEKIEKLTLNHVNCIVYDPSIKKLLIISENNELENLGEGPWNFITLEELKTRLLENETLFSHHVVITGYEQFFAILSSPEIEKRYHPLL